MAVDYVIIGAGSAGCVLADRLSEDGANVVLLEAGPKDRNPMIHIPAGVRSLLYHPTINWNYSTEPQEGTGGRRIHWPRGKVLGGSSSINGMQYVRGNAADYDGWAQRGCRGWTFEDVLPYFKKSESYRNGGDPEVRGSDGPLVVEDARTILPITHRFVEAAQQAGFKLNSDYNGKEQEGVSYSQMTRQGRFRASTARTYLSRAKGRPNLKIETEAVATKLLLEDGKCVGVAYRQGDQDREIRVEREVILSGGSINSPHLLQVSGIGPGEHLRSIGVEVKHDLSGVGGNLSDHYVTRISHRVKNAVTINQMARMPRVIPEIIRWLVKGDGALTFGATTVMVFTRSREGLSSPDLQFLFAPVSFDPVRKSELEREPGMAIAICPGRPDSRGTIMAASPDPLQAPTITPNYLSAESDLEVMLSGVKQARSIFAAPTLAPYTAGETRPNSPIETIDDMRKYAQETGTTVYHPVGTCKMGEDPEAVVDSRLRVHGIKGLRVIDASVMPVVTTGNTNAPTIMIAEKGADMIRRDYAG
ncbi:MAG: GMC family oxidoreductase N-terminal domain-containing protein [Alphaproteobacteria bacterium]|nr:GMC family oxidoreductase N-terminal domain-containing protein [Alphaproteobacteria bacterium]